MSKLVPIRSRPASLIDCICIALLSCVVSSCVQRTIPGPAPAPERTNIVVFYVDDLGMGDIYRDDGNDSFFPNIQRLANEGVTFTNAYSSAPICGPSRAGFITGRYQQRFGYYVNDIDAPRRDRARVPDGGLPVTETTIAERLQKAGYSTGGFGKWHLGGKEPNSSHLQPHRRGFDKFVGFYQGSHNYFGTKGITDNGMQISTGFDYLTDFLTNEAVSFIRDHASGPFFVFLPYNAPHTPIQAPAGYEEGFDQVADADLAAYLAMIRAVDVGIGRVLDTLDDLGIAENTLVIFTSDNGDSPKVRASSGGNLRGHKGQLYEGGIHVPMIMRLTGTIEPLTRVNWPVIHLDIGATALSLAGSEVPAEMEGVNLMPYVSRWKQEMISGPPHEYLFWEHYNADRGGDFGYRRAVRKGQWKYINNGAGDELYDLLDDQSETRNIAATHPGLVGELNAAFDDWARQNAEPLWPAIRHSGHQSGDGSPDASK